VVDAAVENFPRPVPPSVTGELPLIGADGLPAVRASAQRLADDYGVPVASVEHLVARYGSTAVEVLESIRADKSLGAALAGGGRYLRAEVAYAVTHEGALHVTDVLARRVRLLIESADSGASVAPEVAAIMAPLLGWNRRRRPAGAGRRDRGRVGQGARAGLVGGTSPGGPIRGPARRIRGPRRSRRLTFLIGDGRTPKREPGSRARAGDRGRGADAGGGSG
jgi:hypothetical protein